MRRPLNPIILRNGHCTDFVIVTGQILMAAQALGSTIWLCQTGVVVAGAHELIATMPFADLLGVTLEEAGPDRVVARLPWEPRLCTMTGILHGGALMSLADTTGALVAFLGLAEGQTTATITSTTQMFRPVPAGTVRAVAVPLHRGRTTATVQTSLYDDAGHLIAQTTQIQAIR
jgi:1,4-dihydroxy-2-naphthoyl-CoA hydrolase